MKILTVQLVFIAFSQTSFGQIPSNQGDWTLFSFDMGQNFNPNNTWAMAAILNNTCPTINLDLNFKPNLADFPPFPDMNWFDYDQFDFAGLEIDAKTIGQLDSLNCTFPDLEGMFRVSSISILLIFDLFIPLLLVL